MAYIELVIKIPEELYESYKGRPPMLGDAGMDMIAQSITKGTPLPKGHGRLIDEKEIDTVINGIFSDYKCSPKNFLNAIHSQCIEAVGENKAESKEQNEQA